MGDIESMYSRARKMVVTLEWQLTQLEDPQSAAAADTGAPGSLTETLNLLLHEVSALEHAVADSDGDPGRRELWRRRVAALSADAFAQRRAVERFFKVTFAARQELRERGLLLGGAAQRAESVAVNAFVQERASLLGSHAAMDGVAAAAAGVMGALREQRGVLKGAHKRVLDIASSLGVSNSIVRIIERRTVGDKIIVYGGSALIVLLMAVLFWWSPFGASGGKKA
jgi:Golgi SNAP receptor complex protein 2